MKLDEGDFFIDPVVLQKHELDLSNRVVNLKKYFLSDGRSIDAEQVAKHLFPQMQCDVFISHSFNDRDKAVQLAHDLGQYGITAFIDSVFWGSSYDLLRAIDNKYSIPEGKTQYDYQRVTRSAGHVNIILATALQKMIMNSSMLIFLSTENSISTKHSIQDEKKTHSAWIHMELMFSHMLWGMERGRNMLDGMESLTEAPSIFHKAETEHLKTLGYRSFSTWLGTLENPGNRWEFINAAEKLYQTSSRAR
ncbi:toll/interleukin-1 receptor domain-containing protein [Pseudomonas sp. 21LCFQ010]|uniref:toll/interleukin-1 receptor domain-containing protein n=1 Tax=Pseudomonas sp. 21LCFQ010 TaxID=2957506 RepID=UPI002097B19F|nr:toll/interleukin-1 receptor domain-containing protein [Pseudomonas sp. 21LCFQ010]MCO8161091.1 toll/interleukin-1 receptor domain-containing protein [Pseudomonas sp. 21LCFQ010]